MRVVYLTESDAALNATPVKEMPNRLASNALDLGGGQGDLIDEGLAAHRPIMGIAIDMSFDHRESIRDVTSYILESASECFKSKR